MPATLRIGMVAGEPSSDQLGASLIEAILKRRPDALIEGIAGPAMRAAGCRAIARSEQLAVMGFAEVLRRLPALIRLRRKTVRHFSEHPPDVFVGIDSPDFNLVLEGRLKRRGIPTVHWVSPSVWAWRQWRVKKIGTRVDLMLTLFPFEAGFYREHGVAVKFVGHPLADEIQPDGSGAEMQPPVIALLPGSRRAEVQRLLPLFLQTASLCISKRPELRFVLPIATPELEPLCREWLAHSAFRSLPVDAQVGGARAAMKSSRLVLLASGTATLECLLLDRPMVVAYKLHPVSGWLVMKMLKAPWVSLPNQLLERYQVPEFLLEKASADRLSAALLKLLDNPQLAKQQTAPFAQVHEQLCRGAAGQAADAILERCLC